MYFFIEHFCSINSLIGKLKKDPLLKFFSASPSFCFECDLHHLINDKNIYNKDLNIKVKQNKEINKIILKGKSLLQKNRLKKAYELLKEYIINSNIKHPDLFYLYGETCRKLKYMEDAEKF